MHSKSILYIFTLGALFSVAKAQALHILTTTANLESLVKQIALEHAQVESLTKPHQDPHFLEGKPSFMLKVSQADLLVSVGLGLEIGWLPAILEGARNPNISQGGKGLLELGTFVEAIDKPKGAISRAEGDVHPDGNPHYLLDPLRAAKLAPIIAKRLGTLDPKHASSYTKRAELLKTQLESLTKKWQTQLKNAPKEVITYHKTLDYFLERFEIKALINIEPKPGVPPTAAHILSVIKQAKERKIATILVDHYFDLTPAERIKGSVPGMQVKQVAVAVGGLANAPTLQDMYGAIVSALLEKGSP